MKGTVGFLLCLLLPTLALADGSRRVVLREHPFPGHDHLLVNGSGLTGRVVETDRSVWISSSRSSIELPAIVPKVSGVASLAPERGGLRVRLEPGAVASVRSIGDGIVVDVVAAPNVTRPSAAGSIAASTTAQDDHGLIPHLPSPFLATVEGQAPRGLPAPPQASPGPTSSARDPSSTAIVVQAVSSDGAHEGRAVLLPFGRDAGVAAIRHDREVILFFDEEKPLDLSSVTQDPVLGQIGIATAPGVTRLRLRLPMGVTYSLTRVDLGWRLALSNGPEAGRSTIDLRQERAFVHFRLRSPGRAITGMDPVLGVPVLVGTTRDPREGVAVSERHPFFAILSTDAGVAVLPWWDRVLLRGEHDGFGLGADDGGDLHLSDLDAAGWAVADGGRRRLRITADPIPVLWKRLRANEAAAAAAPAQGRFEPRLAETETLLALGFAREAGAVLRNALAASPSSGVDPRVPLLETMIAALDPGARHSDETASAIPVGVPDDEDLLWRALLPPSSTAASPSVERTRVLRAEMPLLLSYPVPLRNAAAGLAAGPLLAGGTPDDLRSLMRLPDGRGTVVAKALVLAGTGRLAPALDRLRALAGSADPLVAANALHGDILLRARSGLLAPGRAAKLLAAHNLDWRLTGQQNEARLEEASFRMEAGQFRRAFDLWRTVGRESPDKVSEVADRMGAALVRLADTERAAAVSPADFVGIVDQNRRDIDADPSLAARIDPLLAEKLEQLGLSGRAAGVLAGAARAAAPGPRRALLDLRAAESFIEAGDASGTAAMLGDADASGLPEDMQARRRLLEARLLAGKGQLDEAIGLLSTSTDRAASGCGNRTGPASRTNFARSSSDFRPRGRLPLATSTSC